MAREDLPLLALLGWVNGKPCIIGPDQFHGHHLKDTFWCMAHILPAKLFSITGGRSILCLYIASTGKHGIAISDQTASAVRDVSLKENFTADSLPHFVKNLKV